MLATIDYQRKSIQLLKNILEFMKTTVLREKRIKDREDMVACFPCRQVGTDWSWSKYKADRMSKRFFFSHFDCTVCMHNCTLEVHCESIVLPCTRIFR